MAPAIPSLERPRSPRVPHQERRVASGSDARTSRRRLVLHITFGVLGWVMFIGLWIWQVEVFVPANWLAGLKLIAIFLTVTVVLTPAWVWWNRSIYRRRHRRTMPLVCSVDFAHDALGRRIAAVPSQLQDAAMIEITVVDEEELKVYAPVPGTPPFRAPAGRG